MGVLIGSGSGAERGQVVDGGGGPCHGMGTVDERAQGGLFHLAPEALPDALDANIYAL